MIILLLIILISINACIPYPITPFIAGRLMMIEWTLCRPSLVISSNNSHYKRSNYHLFPCSFPRFNGGLSFHLYLI